LKRIVKRDGGEVGDTSPKRKKIARTEGASAAS